MRTFKKKFINRYNIDIILYNGNSLYNFGSKKNYINDNNFHTKTVHNFKIFPTSSLKSSHT